MTDQQGENESSELEQSRQLLEATFRSLKDAVFVVKHPERLIEACNPAAEQMFGWEESELVGSSTKPLHVDEEHYERFGRESQQALSEEGMYRGEYRMRRADGSTLYTEHVVTFVGSSDHPDHAVSVVRDITERKEKERQLLLKSRAMDDSPIGILLTDATEEDNPICYVNEGFVRLTGYHQDNILGRNCRFLQGKETDPEVVNQMREAIDAGQPVEVDIRNYRADGEMFWNHLLITPIRNKDGEVTHFIGYQQDITERKEMEESLRKRERLYHTLFEDANVGFLIESLDDVVLEANQAACELLGYTSEEMQGLPLSEITPSKIQEKCGKKNIVKYHLDKHGTSLYNWHYLHKDATRIPVEKSKTPITYKGTDAVLVSVRDRTKLERIRKQDERKSSFVSQVTHDLRTPLNSITGMGTLLKDTDLSGKQQNYLRTILNAARNMERLTNDILDLNRIERGEMILNEEPFNIQLLLGELISLYSQQFSERNLMLSTQVAEDVSDHLVGDPDRLKRILQNLLDNAIKHSNEGSIKIQVDLKERTDSGVTVRFSVSDMGKGIPESKLENIFEQHEQIGTEDSGSTQGLGLGLSICKAIVELMGGEMSVESEVGEGTTVAFTVEFREADEEKFSSVALNDVVVLLVEDNAMVRKVYRKYLEPHNINIAECEKREEALEELGKTSGDEYDVVFLDHRLDKWSGLDLLETISGDLQTIDTDRIYLVTGDAKEKMKEQLGTLSCAGILEKPVDEPTLVQAVSSVAVSQSQKEGEKEIAELQKEIERLDPERFHILIADDENTRILLQELLSPVTDKLIFETNGRDTVGQRFKLNPDLILMDLEMPEMDGLEATEIIRRKEVERDLSPVPIITQTARAMKHVQTKCLEAGADKFVSKPIKRRKLYRAILDILSSSSGSV